jgi:putative spermidine/putrescine transport system permease protein
LRHGIGLVPLLAPGTLTAALLVLVRTIAMFELTFLTAGPDSQTLVVVLYYSVFAAGVRATQSVDAMAVTYMVTTLTWLLIALRFVNPTQLVTRVRGLCRPRGPTLTRPSHTGQFGSLSGSD